MRFSAARCLDPVTHDLGTFSGLIGGPSSPGPGGPVLMEGGRAAHVGCMCLCTGFPFPGVGHPPGVPPMGAAILLGSGKVVVLPAAEFDVEPLPDSATAPGAIFPQVKTLFIRVVGEQGVTIAGKAGRHIAIQIFDPKTLASADYSFVAGGANVSVGLDIAADSDNWDGGGWVSFTVREGIDVGSFAGNAYFGDWHGPGNISFWGLIGGNTFMFSDHTGDYMNEVELDRPDSLEPSLGGFSALWGKMIKLREREAKFEPPAETAEASGSAADGAHQQRLVLRLRQRQTSGTLGTERRQHGVRRSTRGDGDECRTHCAHRRLSWRTHPEPEGSSSISRATSPPGRGCRPSC